MRNQQLIRLMLMITTLAACGGGGGGGGNGGVNPAIAPPVNMPPDNNAGNDGADDLDNQLAALIARNNLRGDAAFNRTLPSIEDPLPQLGRDLFFSKSLGGDFDAACVSCHHPLLGGADGLSLPVGVGATDPDLLGPGRADSDGVPNVPRHSPSVFNVGLMDRSLFWDSRVESFGAEAFANGGVSAIRTPDTGFGGADPNAGVNLVAAQARFPVTSAEEMKGQDFGDGSTNEMIRAHLAERIGNYGSGTGVLGTNGWLQLFRAAFASDSSADALVTFDNIALAIAEYERSMVFTHHPFAAYINGDLDALSEAQKRGAILFYTEVDDGGAGCATCHSGDRFTDESHHIIAFPQIGPGKGDGVAGDDDFGRARESGDDAERYAFRTPTLLNVAVTAPYGHAGTYETLQQVMQHYNNPAQSVMDFLQADDACSLPQFANLPNCAELYPNAGAHSNAALQRLQEARAAGTAEFTNRNINGNERADLVAFLQSLTDPCVVDRNCLAPWIAPTDSAGPDGQQLNAIDASGDLL